VTVARPRPQAGEAIENLDLSALVALAKQADHDAWGLLYQRSYPGLMAFASRRLDRDRASDAVSETMARAVANIDKFNWEGARFDSWLFGILRHVIADVHRTQAREQRRDERTAASAQSSPLEHVLHGEEAASMRDAFARLHPSDRELLELRVVAGLSYEEVAAALGKRPGGVRMAQSRALGRLRKHMEDRA
jgi:RNA polymerase sigma-70 factor (ECF subfamily)